MSYDRKDHLYKRAKREGKVCRAAYKITELDEKFGLLSKGDVVLDLGAAPGGWLKEMSSLVGKTGRVIGVDILPLATGLPPNVSFIQGDMYDDKIVDELQTACEGKVDAIVSDMSPNLSGITFADAYKSYELAILALDMCNLLLKSDGNFAVKIFPGDEFNEYLNMLRVNFNMVKAMTLKSSRKTSSERYIVCKKFKNKVVKMDTIQST